MNLRKYLIIAADEVIQSVGYADLELDECSQFLVNEEIKKLIRDGSVRRKLLSVVYTNPDMNDEAVRELIHYATGVPSISNVIFLVEKGEREEYYELFQEVIFFPTTKKVHIVECIPIPVDVLELKKLDGKVLFS